MPDRLPLVARKTAGRSPALRNDPNATVDVRLGALADWIGFHLRLAQDASFRAFAKHSGQPHLKPGRFAAMMVIHNNPGITQGALGRAIARDKSTVTPLVQELHRHGLVRRSPSTADRRSIHPDLDARRRGDAGRPAVPRPRPRPPARRHRRQAQDGADRPPPQDHGRAGVRIGDRHVHRQHRTSGVTRRKPACPASSPISAAIIRH